MNEWGQFVPDRRPVGYRAIQARRKKMKMRHARKQFKFVSMWFITRRVLASPEVVVTCKRYGDKLVRTHKGESK